MHNLNFDDLKLYKTGSIFRSENGTTVIKLDDNIEVIDWKDSFEISSIELRKYKYEYVGEEELSFCNSNDENYYDGINVF